jgi:hypothetical protein
MIWIYLCVWISYEQSYAIIRNHTQFIILILASFDWSMKRTTSISEKGRMYEAAILME